MNSTRKYWVSVVSRKHILIGIEHCIAQVGHGKELPLKRMRAGDWIVNYSSIESLENRKKCQRFTAIGKIRTGNVYQVDMGNGFKPFRIDVDYLRCNEADIRPILDELQFISNPKRWGYPFRFGHFEISEDDFLLISNTMGVIKQVK